jgi:serine/threonine-protein kinase
MLEKDPARRPPSVGEAVDALVEAARASGYEVPANARRTGDPEARGSVRVISSQDRTMESSKAMATTELGPIAQAKTGSVQTDTPVHRSVEAEARGKSSSARRRTLLIAGATLLGVAIIAASVLGIEGGKPPADASTTPSASAVAPAAPVISTPVEARATAEPSQVVPAGRATTEAAEVDVAVQATPKDVEIWRDGKLVGKAPGPIRLPRGQAVTLTFKAPGYRERTQEVPAGTEGPIAVSLTKVAPTKAAGDKKGDLENPFQ